MLTRSLVGICVMVVALSIMVQSARTYIRNSRHGKAHTHASLSVKNWFNQTSMGKYVHHSTQKYAIDRVAWMKEERLLK